MVYACATVNTLILTNSGDNSPDMMTVKVFNYQSLVYQILLLIDWKLYLGLTYFQSLVGWLICLWLWCVRYVMPVWQKLCVYLAVLTPWLTYSQRPQHFLTWSHRLKIQCLADSFTNLQR